MSPHHKGDEKKKPQGRLTWTAFKVHFFIDQYIGRLEESGNRKTGRALAVVSLKRSPVSTWDGLMGPRPLNSYTPLMEETSRWQGAFSFPYALKQMMYKCINE